MPGNGIIALWTFQKSLFIARLNLFKMTQSEYCDIDLDLSNATARHPLSPLLSQIMDLKVVPAGFYLAAVQYIGLLRPVHSVIIM